MINTQELAVEYEKDNGSIDFIKAAMTAQTLLLIKKGLITEDELKSEFIDEIDRRKND